jgi:hypothetical protein
MRVLLVLLPACVPATTKTAATTAPDTGGCDAADAPVGWDDATTFGLPREVGLRFVFAAATPFTYADGTVTELALALALDESLTPVGRTSLGGDLDCDVVRSLTVPLRLAFETADGAFTEDTVVHVVAEDSGEELRGQPTLAAADHSGTYDLGGWDAVNLAFVDWVPPTAGEVVLQRSTTGECGVGAWNLGLMTGCP